MHLRRRTRPAHGVGARHGEGQECAAGLRRAPGTHGAPRLLQLSCLRDGPPGRKLRRVQLRRAARPPHRRGNCGRSAQGHPRQGHQQGQGGGRASRAHDESRDGRLRLLRGGHGPFGPFWPVPLRTAQGGAHGGGALWRSQGGPGCRQEARRRGGACADGGTRRAWLRPLRARYGPFGPVWPLRQLRPCQVRAFRQGYRRRCRSRGRQAAARTPRLQGAARADGGKERRLSRAHLKPR
mmetsp:Transcript_1369/g.4476  ORF Transcript_1369/g.4476 Transcript_1369/m.4476 type:complete len:238 (-) Transcript_1369:840-1553(-)